MTNPTQRPVTDNTKQSQETDIHAPMGFEPTIPTGEWPQTDTLDRAAARIVNYIHILIYSHECLRDCVHTYVKNIAKWHTLALYMVSIN